MYKREERSHQDLLSFLRMGTVNEERPKQVVCHRAEDETAGLGLEERGKLPPCFAGLLASLAGLAGGFPGNACWRWELG